MKANTKKVLHEQGAQVVQALKWIGGALFGDADDVLDDIAARGDRPERPGEARAQKVPKPPIVEVRTRPATTSRGPAPRGEVIDVEGFAADEDDE
jgi:hypothetical protein